MNPINDGYMILLDEVSFDGKVLGCIAQEGIAWGGDAATYIRLMCAQKRNGPVKKVLADAGTNMLTFNMIQLIAEHCVDIAGGTVNGEVWDAPESVQTKEGAAVIKTGTGQTITIHKATLSGVVRGQLGNSGNLYIESELEILSPDGGSPFSLGPTTPDVSVSESAVSFPAAGGVNVVRISASGAVTLSAAPAGFTLGQDGNYLVITAAANSGAAKTGTITVTLLGTPGKTATIAITQAGA